MKIRHVLDIAPTRACKVACITVALCLVLGCGAASGASGPQLLPDIFPFKSLAAEFASNSSIALLNDLSAKVRDTAQSGLQTLADGPSRFIEAFGRAQSIVSDQFASTPLAAEIQHPFPAYPDTLFTWAECNTSNPYLVVSVRDQEVPLIQVGQAVNESVMSFAISTWAEIAYHDPSLAQYQFKIAEDVIYDVGNDTFAVATPFDVKNGRGQVPGVSSVGPTTGHNGSAMVSDGETYNIKFTFAASPLSKTVSAPAPAPPAADPKAARAASEPTAGVSRWLTGQIDDKAIKNRATDAFTELVARMYFNIVTAALGNLCNPGYAQLIPVAGYMLKRLKQLNLNETTYHGLPLGESLIDDGSRGRLCVQEPNTLYNGANMTLLNMTTASTASECCNACRVTELQTDPSALCNAWIFCGDAMGCHNSDLTFGAAGNMCSLYAAADLDYNTPLDKNVGVVRGLGVNFISGKPLTPGPVQGVAARRTAAVIPDNIMSILAPIRQASSSAIEAVNSFQTVGR